MAGSPTHAGEAAECSGTDMAAMVVGIRRLLQK
jgi:hypothetical protein